MRCMMIKVKTPSIPSRTAANQFHEKHGYDIEFVPQEGYYYVHDLEKDMLHAIDRSEVTNVAFTGFDAKAFMGSLRGGDSVVDPTTKRRGPGRPPKQQDDQP